MIDVLSCSLVKRSPTSHRSLRLMGLPGLASKSGLDLQPGVLQVEVVLDAAHHLVADLAPVTEQHELEALGPLLGGEHLRPRQRRVGGARAPPQLLLLLSYRALGYLLAGNPLRLQVAVPLLDRQPADR